MRVKGKISSWKDDKGFGFITPVNGGNRLFIHVKAFNNRNHRPHKGQVVTYAISTDKQGRPCATKATFAGDRLTQDKKKNGASLHLISSAVFLLIVTFSVLTSKVPVEVLALYIAGSLLTYFVYAIDKKAAKNGSWRIPEKTLHVLAITGGWPGALIAQQTLRHKSKKESFRAVFWVTVLLNCGGYLLLFTATGSSVLKAVLSSVA